VVTTDLINLLTTLEFGASGRPREVSIQIGDKWISEPKIQYHSSGDGCCGAELTLEIVENIKGGDKMKLPSREEARKKTDKIVDTFIEDEMKVIIEKIDKAISIGYYQTDIDMNLSKEATTKLVNLGYIVRRGSQCDAPYTTISW
jgi:hypothetical protein